MNPVGKAGKNPQAPYIAALAVVLIFSTVS